MAQFRQFKIAKSAGNATTLEVTLDDPPVEGNTLVSFWLVGSSIDPVDDGWLRPEFETDFVGAYGYKRKVGSDTPSSISRSQTVPDEMTGFIGEIEGLGPFDEIDILDASVGNKPSQGGATNISSGTIPEADINQPNGFAVAAFFVSRTVSGGASTFGSYTNGFTEVAELGHDTGDMINMAVAVLEDTGDTITDLETTADLIGGDDSRPIGMLFLFKGPPPVTINLKLTGGAANANPATSIGGTISSVNAAATLFDNVTRGQADAGQTDYRMIAVKSVDDNDMQCNATVYITEQPENGQEISVGWAGDTNEAVSAPVNDLTAPAGVSYTTPSELENGIESGVLDPGDFRLLSIRRVAPSNTPAQLHNRCQIRLEVFPL